jgi:hypothetical protein
MSGYNVGYNACSGTSGTTSGRSSSGGSSYADGNRDGKAKGESDALSGRPFDDRCGGPTNEYCFGYKVGYGLEYRITKLLRDK